MGVSGARRVGRRTDGPGRRIGSRTPWPATRRRRDARGDARSARNWSSRTSGSWPSPARSSRSSLDGQPVAVYGRVRGSGRSDAAVRTPAARHARVRRRRRRHRHAAGARQPRDASAERDGWLRRTCAEGRRSSVVRLRPAPRPHAAVHARFGRRRRRGVPDGRATLRVLPGPQTDRFAAGALDALQSAPYRIARSSNRMGFRLSGPPLAHTHGADVISDATPLGVVQVPASGQPILLMADRQTTGGYREDRDGHHRGHRPRGTTRSRATRSRLPCARRARRWRR